MAIAGLTVGVTYNAVTTTNMTRAVSHISEDSGQNFRNIQKSLGSLACMVLIHREALGHLLAEQGGVCAMSHL